MAVSTKKATKKSLLDNKSLVNKYKKTPTANVVRDAKRKAKPYGKRTSAEGNVYYENRANRGDVDPKRKYPKLAKGGKVDDWPFETSNLRFIGMDKDTNGNRVAKVAFGDDRAFSIQSNQNLPYTHNAIRGVKSLQEIREMEREDQIDFGKVEKEINDYVKQYGSPKQKKKLKIYDSLEKGGKVNKYKKGAKIPDNYEGKWDGDIWNSWTQKQRTHFLSDHSKEIIEYDKSLAGDGRGWFYSPLHALTNESDYYKLPRVVQETLASHVRSGQYADGGAIKDTITPNLLMELWFAVHEKRTEDYPIIAKKLDDAKVSYSLQNKVSEDATEARSRKAIDTFEVKDRIDKIINKTMESGGEVTHEEVPDEELKRYLVEENGMPEDEWNALSGEEKNILAISYLADKAHLQDDAYIPPCEIVVVQEEVVTLPSHFGTGENINVFGYTTHNFDICANCVGQFRAAIAIIENESDADKKYRYQQGLIRMAVHIDNIFELEKKVIAGEPVTQSSVKLLTKDIEIVAISNFMSGLNIKTDLFLEGHVWEIVSRINYNVFEKGGQVEKSAKVLIVSPKHPLSTQLEKYTGDSLNNIDFEQVGTPGEPNILRHKKTGEMFIAFTLNYIAQVDKRVIDDDLSYITSIYGITNFDWVRKPDFNN